MRKTTIHSIFYIIMNTNICVFYKNKHQSINLILDYSDDTHDLKLKLTKKIQYNGFFNEWIYRQKIKIYLIRNKLIFSKLPDEILDIIIKDCDPLNNILILFNEYKLENNQDVYWFFWNRTNHIMSNEDSLVACLG